LANILFLYEDATVFVLYLVFNFFNFRTKAKCFAGHFAFFRGLPCFHEEVLSFAWQFHLDSKHKKVAEIEYPLPEDLQNCTALSHNEVWDKVLFRLGNGC